ncbi:MAG: RdgB/HAM1 family non-canonical purine NTP pyrophosphatase [Candidatus Microgenomates bacterium]
MKKLLIATTNPAKIEEIKYGLKNLKRQNIQILTLNDVEVEETPEETGKTFEENSLLKAKFYSRKTSLLTLADDGGLIIPYLNNEPGVKSRRWLGYEATDEELINYTLKRLANVSQDNRLAYLETCLTFYISDNIYFQAKEKIKGYIAEKPSKKPTNGYPFRALFIVEKYNKYYDELTEKQHQQINHRLKALKKLIPNIKKFLLE